MMNTFAVNVATTPTLLVAPNGRRYPQRDNLIVTNTSASDVYVGGPAVSTTAYTYKVPTGQVLSISNASEMDQLASEQWYGVAAAPVTITCTEQANN